MADNVNKTLQVEEVAEVSSIAIDRTVIPTAASTTILTDTSTSQYIFTGT